MANFPEKEKYTGQWNGQTVSFNREWSGHRFSDAECEALLNGAEIIIEAKSKKTGNLFSVCGKLGEGEYNGKHFIAFQPDFNRKIIPVSFLSHVISPKERKALEEGQEILVDDLVSKAGNKFEARLRFNEKDGLQMAFGNGIGEE